LTDFEIIKLLITNASEAGGVFNWRFVFEHTVNLVLLLGIIIYVAKDSVKSFLIQRRSTISNEIDEAQKTITEAKKRYEEYAEKLKAIEQEINNITDTIRNQGETERKELIRQGEVASENIKKEAKETIHLETEKARREIQSEAVTLALIIAEKVIKENLGESDKERLIEEFTKNIGDEKWHQSQH